MLPEEIIQAILSNLLTNLANDAAGTAMGWMLNYVITGSGKTADQYNQILTQFQTLESQISVLETDMQQIQSQLQALANGQTWYSYQTALANDISDIESNYTTLQELQTDDVDTANALKVWGIGVNPTSYLLTLHEDITGTVPADPATTQGMLSLYSLLLVEEFQANSADQHDDVSAGSPFDIAAINLKQYFLYLVGVQTKCLTLLTNACVASAETDLAKDAITLFISRLQAQCQTYLAAMESLVVGCTVDLSLMDVFGLVTSVNPLQEADLLIDTLLSNVSSSPPVINTTFYARLWVGIGTPSLPYKWFRTNTLSSLMQAVEFPVTLNNYYPILIGSTGNQVLPNLLTDGSYAITTVFPAYDNCQWVMLRASWTTPNDDTYSILMQSATDQTNLLSFNPLIVPASIFGRYILANALVFPNTLTQYTNATTPFTFNSVSAPANEQAAVFVGSASLLIDENHCYYAGDLGGNAGVYNFGYQDFSVSCWVCINMASGSFVANGSYAVLMSSKCGYGGIGTHWTPGATGFWLALTPTTISGNSISASVSMRLDDGGSFYEVVSSDALTIQDGQWCHFTAVRQAKNLLIYVNGTSVAVTTNPYNTNSNVESMNLYACWNMMFGCQNGNPNYEYGYETNFQPENIFIGCMNEAAVWQGALSPAQIQQLQLQPAATIPENLLGYWPFTDGALDDQSSNANGPANLTGSNGNEETTVTGWPTYLPIGNQAS